jgi:Insertion element 4 transposase N-terminal
VVVCLLLAAAVFEPAGYPAVWRKLTGALDGSGVARVTAAALWQARTRLGPGPGTDPGRASFTTALHAARDQVTQAAGVIAGETIDLAGTTGQHIPDNLLPARRLRVSPRPSNGHCRATPTRACASTGAPTGQRSASTS